MEKAKPHSRRADVLRLLVEHGTMSAAAIVACIDPPIQPRRFREVIARLKKYEWIRSKQQFGDTHGQLFYFVSTKARARRAVADHLGLEIGEIRPPFFRRTDLIHSDHCALWKEYLGRRFPDALILRDHEFHYLDVGNKLLMSHREDNDLNPDMLLVFRRPEFSRPVCIAVEVERNVKGPARLARKLQKYASETYLDGIIYFCEAEVRQVKIKESYRNSVLSGVNRISHFGDNFALMSDSAFCGFSVEPEMFNSAGKRVSLADWVNTLLNSEEYQRDNDMFPVLAAGGC
ncbi:hypothetical protein GW916_11530 [bacterium]|nr:hypothetical protein [bacterium]